jgi:Cys-tRNA(Pro)/Cys-tRNA(Cys) deacylase
VAVHGGILRRRLPLGNAAGNAVIMPGMADTNAIKWLRARDVDFAVLAYEYTEFGAAAAAEAVGRPLEMVCKTLLLKATGNAYWLAIVPGDQELALKRVAGVIGAKTVDLPPRDEAEKVTGYQVGGISPFAQRRPLPVLIEESLLVLDRLVVNGGRRGVLVELATADLVALLDAQAADICRG